MIQRIQTIFLFLSFAMGAILIFVNPIYAEYEYELNGINYQVVFQYWSTFGEEVQYGLMMFNYQWIHFVLLLGLSILTFTAIFLFRNPKIQIYLIIISTVFTGLLTFCLMYDFISFRSSQVIVNNKDLNAHIFWTVLITALNLLSIVAIQFDRRSIPQNYFASPKG